MKKELYGKKITQSTCHLSYITKVMAAVLIIVTIPLAVNLLISYDSFCKHVMDNVYTVSKQQVDGLATGISAKFGNYQKEMDTLYESLKEDLVLDVVSTENVSRALSEVCRKESDFSNLLLYKESQDILISAYPETAGMLFHEADVRQLISQLSRISDYIVTLLSPDISDPVTCVKTIRQPGTREYLGYLIARLPRNFFESSFESVVYPYGQICCVNRDGKLLYQSGEDPLPIDISEMKWNTGFVKSGNYYLYSMFIPKTSFYIFSICPSNAMQLERNDMYAQWIILLIVIVVLWVVFSVLSPYFLKFNNIMNLLMYTSVIGITSTVVFFLIVSGNLDLSVGSIANFAGIMAATVMQKIPGKSYTWIVGILVGLAIGGCIGLINGLLITKVHINAMICTLGMMTIFRGACYLPNGSFSTLVNDQTFKYWGQGKILGRIPVIVVIMLLFFVLFFLVSRYTIFGRYIFSIGGNSQASYLAGINIQKVTCGIFVIVGVVSATAGLLQTGLSSSGVPSASADLAMDCITAVILGGTSMLGGKGSLFGTFLGVLILGTISNGLSLLNMSAYYQQIFKGAVLLFAVGIDGIRQAKNQSN